MANEATCIYQIGPNVPMTVSDGAGIEKGTVLKLSDPATGAASSADGDIFLGITMREKVANDGVTKVPVCRSGVFKMKDSGSGVTAGDPLKIDGANLVATADDASAAGIKEVIGMALETAAASDTLLVWVGAF